MNNRLNIQDLARLLSEQTGKERETIERFLREFISVVSEGVYTDKLVKVKGLGTFKIILVEKRESIHVNTGERFLIPAHYKFSFLPDKELREQVNKPFSFFETTEIGEHVDFTDIDVSDEEKDTEDESVEEVMPDREIPLVEEIVEPLVESVPELSPVLEPDSEPEPVQEEQIESGPALGTISEPEEEPEVELESESDPKPESEPELEPLPEPVNPVTHKSGRKGMYLGIIGVAIVLVSSSIIYMGKERWLKAPVRQAVAKVRDTVENSSVKQDTLLVVNEPVAPPKPTVLDSIRISTGDRLTMIALKYYGDKLFWVYLYQHNKERIKDPNNVPIGTMIVVPAPELYGIDTNSRESRDKAAAFQTEILTGK